MFEHSSAVRGYHYYRKYWQPTTNQTLECFHERDNLFDFFAIKVCDVDSGMIVGHLPRENSRATKFLLDRGARVIAVLTSTNYCVSSHVQGGLEIPCRVEISMPPTVKIKQILNIFKEMVDLLYYEREEMNKVGSFLVGNEEAAEPLPPKAKKKKLNRKEQTNQEEAVTPNNSGKDIRSFFQKKKVVTSSSSSKQTSDVIIEISDSD